ncbi:MAG: DDE-type integrase/transposase/recombinase [Sulfuricurvum sp.]|jgi:transposase InsO family protein|uniref:DDE-type integrase/transposase/recombinase n=1 Tax=Sulfuricurvum sp. TaxID=2025608 RepID=UPI0025D39A7A|nr:DDE-type integrase/transposase/recombinase [Sulfuricurvum sp.]MCK9372604.1 DDE-type integrase/transposase/recombinase [Sulfuricurvum sp.]
MWVPVKEASAHFGVGDRAIQIACNRGSKKYQFQKVEGKGGRGEVYEIWIGENDGRETESNEAPERSGGVDQKCEVADFEQLSSHKKRGSVSNSKTGHSQCDVKSIDPREALKLKDKKRIDAELRCRLVMEFEKRPKGMTIEVFIGELSINYESLNVTTSKINRWLGTYRKAKKEGRNVIVALADNSGRPKGITKLTEEMKAMIVRYLLRRDVHLNISGIYANLKYAFGDALPSRNTVERYIEEWKEKNALQWEIRVNPNRAKSHFQPAHGSRSEHIKYKNQVWELDGTIADIITIDAKRWTIVGAIDVFSRRVVVTLEESNTTFALARNMRKAIIKLGIPDMVLTDNGKDYKSNHFESVCLSLGIEQKFTEPFSGDQKPHIERFFGTLTRELFRSIEGFCGHSVAERQAIQSSLTFEDRLQAIEKWKAKSYGEDGFAKLLRKKEQYGGLPIEVPLTPEELESWIDRWVSAMYEQERHSSINMSPITKWESDFTPANTVGNLRSLDFLLGKSEYRTITKKGIVITRDGITGEYHHPSIAGMTGKKVMVIEPDEMGEVLVYSEKREFLCIAIDETLQGRSREESAAIVKAYKKEVKAYVKANKEMDRLAKELDDPLITHRIEAAEQRLGLSAPEIRTPKATKEIIAANAAAEAKSSCEEPKINSTRKWETMYDRFLDKMLTKTWDEKDTALSEKYPDLYEMALAEVEKKKKAS